jgi:coenzyme F420-reducing hydrogenase beta subunit
MTSPVISRIVENDICIGCGFCAALCPDGVLKLMWNRYGEYNPFEAEFCKTECGLCLKTCPFADNNENEDSIGKRLYQDIPGMSYRSETGYALSSFVGYADKYRQGGASGGVATWLLENLLTKNIVDHIVCAVPTGDPDRLFSFKIINTAEEVMAGASSVYYPLEVSGIIKQILDMPGRYAITGLPCFIKALRLAQQRNVILKERVVITVGLTCSQLKSKHFTAYVSALSKANGKVEKAHYRGKSPGQPTSNYFFSFRTEKNEQTRIYWKEGIGQAWTSRWFTPNACDYCDDTFAECADVTCMDAWLPEYSQDTEGTNIVLVRSPIVLNLIQEGVGIQLNAITIEKVLQSQLRVVTIKRQHLACRLYLDRQRGRKIPRKRVTPAKPHFIFRLEVQNNDRARLRVRNIWFENPNASFLRERMRLSMKLMEYRRMLNWINFVKKEIIP